MRIKSIFYNMLTIGGEYRFQVNKKEYESLYIEYKEYYEKIQPLLTTKLILEENVHRFLSKIKNIFEEFNLEKFIDEAIKKDILQNPAKFIFTKDINKLSKTEVTTVIGSSIALPITTYSLIANFGLASTGTSISSIPAIVQSGTILSWLGGGSIATGGLGITVGQFVLPALALLPLSYFVIKKHKTASQYKEKIKQFKEVLRNKLSSEMILAEINTLNGNISLLYKKEEDFENDLAVLCEKFASEIVIILKN